MKIIKNRPFKATVKVAFPGDAYSADDSFVGHFVALDRETLKGLQGELLTDEGQDAYLDQIFTGWEGLVDSTDAPFEVTPENRKGLLSDLPVRQAIMRSYAEEIVGLRRGN